MQSILRQTVLKGCSTPAAAVSVCALRCSRVWLRPARPWVRTAAGAASSVHQDVYDPLADENYTPPAKEVSATGPRVADFRSDTVTKPTAEMTIVMIDAVVGDDVYGEDPTVRRLCEIACELTHKEAALFTPSGTQANLIAVGVHAGRGDAAIVGDLSHIHVYEQAGASGFMGVHLHTLPNLPDGRFLTRTSGVRPGEALGPQHTLEYALTHAGGGAPSTLVAPRDVHSARIGVVCLENTHNLCGGAPLSREFVDEVSRMCVDAHVRVHMDGARLFNACTVMGYKPAEILKNVDSASICLSKGLGAPVGSLLVGSAAFIHAATRMRKALGGGMRQAGVIAAPGIVALKNHSQKLAADHTRARSLARGLAAIPGIVIDTSKVKTNILYFDLDASTLCSAHFLTHNNAPESWTARGVTDTRVHERLEKVVRKTQPGADVADVFASLLEALALVRAGSYGGSKLRAVTHHQVTDEDVEAFLSAASTAVQLLRKP